MTSTFRSTAMLVSAALFCAVTVGPAAAQSQPTPEMREKARAVGLACRAEIRSLCGQLQPGGGQVARCLAANEAKLGAGCRAAFATVKAPAAP